MVYDTASAGESETGVRRAANRRFHRETCTSSSNRRIILHVRPVCWVLAWLAAQTMIFVPHLAAAAAPTEPIPPPVLVGGGAPTIVVVGLQGDSGRAADLTEALRAALRDDNWEVGPAVSMQRVLDAGGCTTPEDSCIATGAAGLEAEIVIFGDLQVYGERSAVVRLSRLDLPGQVAVTHTTVPLTIAELASEVRPVTAKFLIGRLLPARGQLPTAAPTLTDSNDAAPRGPATRSDPLVWGAYRPRPTWKVVFVGASAAVTGLALAATISTALLHSRSNARYNDALADSTAAAVPENIAAGGSDAVCRWAALDTGGDLNREDLADECRISDQLRPIRNTFAGVTAVAGAATIAATVLLFVHRSKRGSTARIAPEISSRFFGVRVAARF